MFPCYHYSVEDIASAVIAGYSTPKTTDEFQERNQNFGSGTRISVEGARLSRRHLIYKIDTQTYSKRPRSKRKKTRLDLFDKGIPCRQKGGTAPHCPLLDYAPANLAKSCTLILIVQRPEARRVD